MVIVERIIHKSGLILKSNLWLPLRRGGRKDDGIQVKGVVASIKSAGNDRGKFEDRQERIFFLTCTLYLARRLSLSFIESFSVVRLLHKWIMGSGSLQPSQPCIRSRRFFWTFIFPLHFVFARITPYSTKTLFSNLFLQPFFFFFFIFFERLKK